MTSPFVKKPEWHPNLHTMIARLPELEPSDLPDPPWTLKNSEGRRVAAGFGGGFCRVTNNSVWLSSINLDVSQGPNGPRAINGAIQEDLQALGRVLLVKACENGLVYLCDKCGAIWESRPGSEPSSCWCGEAIDARTARLLAEQLLKVSGPESKRARRFGL